MWSEESEAEEILLRVCRDKKEPTLSGVAKKEASAFAMMEKSPICVTRFIKTTEEAKPRLGIS